MRRRTLQAAWRMAGALSIAALPAVTLACGDALGADADVGANLSAAPQEGIAGMWQINREASDAPFARTGARQHPREGQRPGRPGGPSGRMGRGPGGPAGPGPLDGERGVLTIVVEDGSVTLTHGNGQTVTLPTDGQDVVRDGRGGEVRVSASWDGDALVVRHLLSMGTRTETFALSADGRQLVVVATMTGDQFDGAPEHRRVYDPFTDS